MDILSLDLSIDDAIFGQGSFEFKRIVSFAEDTNHIHHVEAKHCRFFVTCVAKKESKGTCNITFI